MRGIDRLPVVQTAWTNVQELAHGVADGDGRLVGMLGADALVERVAGMLFFPPVLELIHRGSS